MTGGPETNVRKYRIIALLGVRGIDADQIRISKVSGAAHDGPETANCTDGQGKAQVFPEMRERAVRLVLDSSGQPGARWQAPVLLAVNIGCASQTLNERGKKAEVDSGKHPGVASEMARCVKVLERENRELRQVNQILRKASTCFATAEFDRRSK
jgi:transposase-like protein